MFGNGKHKTLYRMSREERDAIAPLIERAERIAQELRIANEAVGLYALAVANRRGLGECAFNRATLSFEPIPAEQRPVPLVPMPAVPTAPPPEVARDPDK